MEGKKRCELHKTLKTKKNKKKKIVKWFHGGGFQNDLPIQMVEYFHIRACQSPLPVAKILPAGLKSVDITEFL
jgi:hypothetical protein